MLGITLYCLLFLCIPGLLLLFSPKLRSNAFYWLPISVLVQWLGMAILASLLRDTPFDSKKLALCFGISSIGTVYLIARVGFRQNGVKIFQATRLWRVVLLALLVTFDVWLILGRQGWSFAEGNLWPHETSYFRGPFNTDAQRSTNVVSSLLRGGASPFLPHSKYRFQLLWFHWSALMVSHVKAITLYPYVQGTVIATALVLAWVLIWALHLMRPGVMFRRWGWLVLLLIFSHADLYHFVGSMVLNHRPGMEADGSFPWIFFRNFSLKLTSLVSGHHAAFFAVLAAFLAISKAVTGMRRRFLLEGMLFVGMVLVSPVLSSFFFVFYMPALLWKSRDRWRTVFRYGLFTFVGAVVHCGVLGFSPAELFFREVKNDLHFALPQLFSVRGIVGVISLPLFPVAVSGVLGLVVLGLSLRALIKKWSLPWPLLSVYFGGNLFCYYGLAGTEFQRHFAILSGIVAGFILVRTLPKKPKLGWAFRQAAVVTVVLHLYFILSFTLKPNEVDPDIPWKDYFTMNQIIAQKYSQLGILQPLAHLNGGFPIVMEAAASFSLPIDVFIHNKTPKEILPIIARATAARSLVPYARELGYELLTWGPLEEKRWGDKVRGRFIKDSEQLERVGEVRLYRWTDALRTMADEMTFEQAGDLFNQEGWEQEAFESYEAALKKDSKNSRVWNNLGELMLRGGRPNESLSYFEKAIELEPANAIGHFNLATAYALMGERGLSLREFLMAENQDKKFFRAREMVGKMLKEMGREDLAKF